MTDALGPNGGVMTSLVPELAPLLGPQPPVPELSPAETQNRFHLVLRNFMRALARRDHPVVLVLDDLQWADRPTLDVLELLVGDREQEGLLVVGTYRDNQVDAAHPLTKTVERIAGKRGAPITLELRPLGARRPRRAGRRHAGVRPRARRRARRLPDRPHRRQPVLRQPAARGRARPRRAPPRRRRAHVAVGPRRAAPRPAHRRPARDDGGQDRHARPARSGRAQARRLRRPPVRPAHAVGGVRQAAARDRRRPVARAARRPRAAGRHRLQGARRRAGAPRRRRPRRPRRLHVRPRPDPARGVLADRRVRAAARAPRDRAHAARELQPPASSTTTCSRWSRT